MGVLRPGRYTYGNDTNANILALTGMSLGDTVFDTTHSQKRWYDGDNWIHGNQVSQVTVGGLLDGAVMINSSTVDNQTTFHSGAGDTEGIIGVAEDSTGGAGATVPITYGGNVWICLVTAGSGADNAEAGDAVELSTTSGGYGDIKAYGVGTFGIYIDVTATATGERRILFKGTERA